MRRLGVLVVLIATGLAGPAHAVRLEPVGTFDEPIFVTSLPADPSKLIVVERPGRLRLATPAGTSLLLDATSLVGEFGFEEGLLSVALAPDFTSSGRLYIAYGGGGTDHHLQIDEFTFSGDSVPMDSRRPVLTIGPFVQHGHYGGQLQFGPDGHLYISTGDGASPGDVYQVSQNLDSLLGKILRIDPLPEGTAPYSVPAGNPFAGPAVPGAGEIWSYGLRSPHRFSFDRLTGALAIADVGQTSYEELSFELGADAGMGDNFGWSCREGGHPFTDPTPDPACATASGFTDPLFEYPHAGDRGGCSITGGYVVRDPGLPELAGRYVYSDFCDGQIRSLDPYGPDLDDRGEGVSVSRPVSFGEDASGRVYVTSIHGSVFRLVPGSPGGGGNSDPIPEEHPPEAAPGSPSDTHGPSIRIDRPAAQRLGGDHRIGLELTSDEPAVVALSPAIGSEPPDRARRSARARRIRLPRKSRSLDPAVPRRVDWALPRRLRKRIRARLRSGARVEVTFRATATDAAGNSAEPLAATARLVP